MASLKAILKDLDTETCARVIETPIYLARESYRLQKNTVECHDELYALIVDYMNHLVRRFLRSDVNMPESMAFDKALKLLRIPNLVPIYDRAIRGYSGGVHSILDQIAQRYCEEQTHAHIQRVLETAISDPLDYQEIEELVTEYIESYGQFLPFELRNKALLCASYRELLANHSNLLNQIRSMVGQI